MVVFNLEVAWSLGLITATRNVVLINPPESELVKS